MSRSFCSKLAPLLMSLALAAPGVANASGNGDARIRALGRRIADHPSDKELYARRSMLFCEQGDFQAAEADLAEIRRIDSAWPQTQLVRARCMLSQNKLNEARADIAAFRLRVPDDPDGLKVEAEVLFRLERWADSAKEYVRYLSLAERPAVEDYLNASQALEQQGEEARDEASRVLAWGLRKLGEVPALRERYIQLALDAGDPEGALRRVEEAMTAKQKGPKEEERWLFMRGDVLCALSRYDEARSAYRAALTALERKPLAKKQEPEVVRLKEKIEAALAGVERSKK